MRRSREGEVRRSREGEREKGRGRSGEEGEGEGRHWSVYISDKGEER